MSKQLFNVNIKSIAATGYVYENRDVVNHTKAEVTELLYEAGKGKRFLGDSIDMETGIVVHRFDGNNTKTEVTVTPVV